VWSFERLNQYINNNVASNKGIEVDWVFRTLTVSSLPKLSLRHSDFVVRY